MLSCQEFQTHDQVDYTVDIALIREDFVVKVKLILKSWRGNFVKSNLKSSKGL